MKNKNVRLDAYILAVIICLFSVVVNSEAASPAPQGPIGGPQIATIITIEGDVRVNRAATPNNQVRVTTQNFVLASGDAVRTFQGKAAIRFNDQSLVSLNPGTTVVITERAAPAGIQRTITQVIGSLWFNITRLTGSSTTLTTPTAVAAIRGTQGTQDVPGPDQSTHALDNGVEDITENITGQTVTIRDGQRVTAIRGIGFAPIVAFVGALAQPIFAAQGGGGGGVAGGGGAGAGAGGAGAATGAATASVATVTATSVSSLAASVASVALPAVGATVTAAIPYAANNNVPTKSGSDPLSPPGGALTNPDGGVVGKLGSSEAPTGTPATTLAYAPPQLSDFRTSDGYMAKFGGAIPLSTASGSLLALGLMTHNANLTQAGVKTTQAVLSAQTLAGALQLFAHHDNRQAYNAARSFAFASALSRQYHNKPLVVIGSYGFATAVSVSGVSGQRRPVSEVVIGAAVGEILGRIFARHREQD
jgi:hypothetical protein